MLHHLTEILNRELLTEKDKFHADMRVSLNSTGIIQTSSIQDRNRNVTNNALIEAFGIHARSLLDFFYGLEVIEIGNRKPHTDEDAFVVFKENALKERLGMRWENNNINH